MNTERRNKFAFTQEVRLKNGYTGMVLDVPGDERLVDGSGILKHYRVAIRTPDGILGAFFAEGEMEAIEENTQSC